MFKIECVCGNCGEVIRISPGEVKNGKLILTLDENHVCFDGDVGYSSDQIDQETLPDGR